MYPHLIVIMADQLRYDCVRREFTPHINALIEDSCYFPHAYCASPLCVPARGAFFTGLYPNTNGSLINPWEKEEYAHGCVKAATPTLYSLLEDSGYDSWHTGKQHLFIEGQNNKDPGTRTHWLTLENGYHRHLKNHGKRPPGGAAFRGLMPEMKFGHITRAKHYSIPTTGCYEEGFEYFFDGYILEKSLRAVRSRDRSKPFALNAMFLAPHPPLEIPQPWFSQISDIDLPENVGVWSEKQSPLQLYNLTGFLGSRYTREDWQEPWRVYAGLVALLDHCVGQIIDALKREGLYDDALILFTPDHGEMLGSHGLWQKMCMYEESVRTPTAFKLPGRTAKGKVVPDRVSHLNVLPTICDYLGLAAPQNLAGSSLRPFIQGRGPSSTRPVFIQFDGNGARGNFSRCVIEGNDKLIVDFFKDEVYFELYDIGSDPQEQHNRAFTETQRAHELLAWLQTHMTATGDLLTLKLGSYLRFLEDYR